MLMSALGRKRKVRAGWFSDRLASGERSAEADFRCSFNSLVVAGAARRGRAAGQRLRHRPHHNDDELQRRDQDRVVPPGSGKLAGAIA